MQNLKNMRKTLYLAQKLQAYLNASDAFTEVMQLKGKPFRDVPGRKTIQVQLGGASYFVKQHFGVGWKEIFKNIFSFKIPIISAQTEKTAIEKLNAIGIATTPLVGFGERGCNPATLQSFIITEDLGNIISLEDLCSDWKNNPPPIGLKRVLIIAVAKLARQLHENGLNHRDFYLCHLCVDAALLEGDQFKNAGYPYSAIKLYLIDLHRMLMHRQPNFKSNMKDIAALYFSALGIGLLPRDLLRFKFYYQYDDVHFWQQVEARATKLHARFHSDKFQQKLASEKALLNK
jgi:heptose I phosphotransferase